MTQALGRGVGGVIDHMTFLLRTVGRVLAWNGTNVLQPIMAWVYSAVMPGIELLGNVIGGLLDKVGRLLGWLGDVLGLSAKATAAANGVPQPKNAPLVNPSAGPQAAVVVPPAAPVVPRFDFTAEAAKAAGAFKGVTGSIRSNVKEGVNDGLAAVKDFKMPAFKMPALGQAGSSSSGTEAAAGQTAAARPSPKRFSPDRVQSNNRGLLAVLRFAPE